MIRSMNDILLDISLKSVKIVVFPATLQTDWYCALMTDVDGVQTVVEFSCGNSSGNVAKLIVDFVQQNEGVRIRRLSDLDGLLGIDNTLNGRNNMAVMRSAMANGLIQIRSCKDQMPLQNFLGGNGLKSVDLYANINRSLFATDRSPSAFAEMAERAVDLGYTTIKCAPFDEVNRALDSKALLEVAELGIRRVKEIRSSVGDSCEILVDCHGRFTIDTAFEVADKLNRLGVSWFEEPVDPVDYIEELREIAQDVPIPIAAGESGYGLLFFENVLEVRGLDILMPDVKYCGGAAEAVEIANMAVSKSVGFSMHCPSGPVSLLLSAHVSAAVSSSYKLEHAVAEVDWRSKIMDPSEVISQGRLHIPDGPGLGASLTEELLKYGEVIRQ